MTAPKLTEAQLSELLCVLTDSPGSSIEHDREAHRWLRGVTRKATCVALVRVGLAEAPVAYDYPIGGYRARLTDEGLARRRELLAERRGTNAAVRALLDAVRGVTLEEE